MIKFMNPTGTESDDCHHPLIMSTHGLMAYGSLGAHNTNVSALLHKSLFNTSSGRNRRGSWWSASLRIVGHSSVDSAPWDRAVHILRAGLLNDMQIRLIRKLANYLDGIDVVQYREGDLLDIPKREAELLIAERWAAAVVDAADRTQCSRPTDEQLRGIREQLEAWSVQPERRRAEDLIREELRDAQGITLHAKGKT